MPFTIALTDEAQSVLDDLQTNDTRKHLKVLKTLGLMQSNIRHPGLHTHEYSSLQGPNGEKVFEAYVENRTPAAYRVFWYYGPGQNVITVLTITPHP
jgi:hypothetical protein